MHKTLVKFGPVVFEICERTDRQTYSSQHFAPLPSGEVNKLITVSNFGHDSNFKFAADVDARWQSGQNDNLLSAIIPAAADRR